MSSILLYGSTSESRAENIEKMLEKLDMEQTENNPDLLVLEPLEKKKSIGIGQSKMATKFLIDRPFSHKNKVVVINKAELLTVQAQNALLKTLEEPPSYAVILLNAKTEDSLLETVTSRCRKTRVADTKRTKTKGLSVKEVTNLTIGDRLTWAGDYAKEDRGHVIETLEGWVHELRNNLTYESGTNIKSILTVKKDLENTNVSLKLALENLSLKLKTRP